MMHESRHGFWLLEAYTRVKDKDTNYNFTSAAQAKKDKLLVQWEWLMWSWLPVLFTWSRVEKFSLRNPCLNWLLTHKAVGGRKGEKGLGHDQCDVEVAVYTWEPAGGEGGHREMMRVGERQQGANHIVSWWQGWGRWPGSQMKGKLLKDSIWQVNHQICF